MQRCDTSNQLSFFFIAFATSTISSSFPYTTLFRSKCGRLHYGVQTRAVKSAADNGDAGESIQVGQHAAAIDDDDVRVLADRKSTRLNSRHLVITYAVFCLQKKNTNKKKAARMNYTR